jgi:hypothetical protein
MSTQCLYVCQQVSVSQSTMSTQCLYVCQQVCVSQSIDSSSLFLSLARSARRASDLWECSVCVCESVCESVTFWSVCVEV